MAKGAGKATTYRKKTRELLVRLVFQMSSIGSFSEAEKAAFLADASLYADIFDAEAGESPDMAYFDHVFACLSENLEAVDAALAAASEKWATARMNIADLAVLRVAAAELLYVPEIDAASSVDEGVRLAKKYGSEQSGPFVNGVLGAVVKKAAAS